MKSPDNVHTNCHVTARQPPPLPTPKPIQQTRQKTRQPTRQAALAWSLGAQAVMGRTTTLLGAPPGALQTLGARWAGQRHQQHRKPSPLSTSRATFTATDTSCSKWLRCLGPKSQPHWQCRRQYMFVSRFALVQSFFIDQLFRYHKAPPSEQPRW